MSLSNQRIRIDRDETLGITREIITNTRSNGEMSPSQHYFFIDDDECEYRSIDDVIDALNQSIALGARVVRLKKV